MDLVAGVVGIAQEASTFAIRPAIGWGVRQDVPVEASREAGEPGAGC